MDEGVRLIQEFFEEKVKVTPDIIADHHTFGSTFMIIFRIPGCVSNGKQ